MFESLLVSKENGNGNFAEFRFSISNTCTDSINRFRKKKFLTKVDWYIFIYKRTNFQIDISITTLLMRENVAFFWNSNGNSIWHINFAINFLMHFSKCLKVKHFKSISICFPNIPLGLSCIKNTFSDVELQRLQDEDWSPDTFFPSAILRWFF